VVPQVELARKTRGTGVQAGFTHGFLEAPAEVPFFFRDRHAVETITKQDRERLLLVAVYTN
jgi:hypothetical protein